MDSLQSAAQSSSWAYMIHTLDKTLKTAENAAMDDLNTRTQSLQHEESDMHEQRVRYEAEKDIEILDDLDSEQFREGPELMHRFSVNDEECSKIINEGLNLSAMVRDPIPLEYEGKGMIKVFNDYLDGLDHLTEETTNLSGLVRQLSNDAHEDSTFRTPGVSDAIGEILLVLSSRGRNLTLTRALVETTKMNWCKKVTLESHKG